MSQTVIFIIPDRTILVRMSTAKQNFIEINSHNVEVSRLAKRFSLICVYCVVVYLCFFFMFFLWLHFYH